MWNGHSGSQIPLIEEQITSFGARKFLDFCRRGLCIDGGTVEAFKMQGDIGEELKYKHVQQSYRANPAQFIRRHGAEWNNHFPRNPSSFPDELPQELVYSIIDSASHSAATISWQRYARETLGISISNNDLKFCPRSFSDEQKLSMLDEWKQQQAGDIDVLARLCELFYDYQRQERTFQ